MSVNEDATSLAGFDETDHQPAYVYCPAGVIGDAPVRSSKRRRISKRPNSVPDHTYHSRIPDFNPLLSGLESPECVSLRQKLYEQSWSQAEAGIQSILNEANEDTLVEVTEFVNGGQAEASTKIPTGFIVTGPNIASQDLLFKQLSSRLKEDIDGPVVILRSGDASNLKAVLKQIIRDATNQKQVGDDDEGLSFEHDGRKLLNYDLEILHNFVKSQRSQQVVVAFQDSEGFDAGLVADIVALFSSWMDRISFLLLFGIATSVDLFHERLSRAASRCLYGRQFDIEQASSLLERIFQKAVAGCEAPLRLGSEFVSTLMERQHDHFQSVQSFITALKYSYMRNFYDDALSILSVIPKDFRSLAKLMTTEHFKAVRTLPSFKKLVQRVAETRDFTHARALLKDDNALLREIGESIASRRTNIHFLVRGMHLLTICSQAPVGKIDLYITTFQGSLGDSDLVQRLLESIKRMAPEDLIGLLKTIHQTIKQGAPDLGLVGWAEEDPEFLKEIMDIESKVSTLVEESLESGNPVRSSYAIHSKGVRTTVIAQRVQLSYEKSTLTKQDKQFTDLVDHLSQKLIDYFTLDNPQDFFLNEVWLYDHTQLYRKEFTPRPRAAIEKALSAPYEYLNCDCCEPVQGLSSTHPATAILYQMYLETDSLINIFDLWSAFLEMVSGGESQKIDERDALVLFYRALADLKSLGMVKQSKKKADHLAKVMWEGL